MINTKKNQKIALFVTLVLFIGAISMIGCRRKEGCPSMNQHVKTGKNGQLPMKRGKTGLFPKGMR